MQSRDGELPSLKATDQEPEGDLPCLTPAAEGCLNDHAAIVCEAGHGIFHVATASNLDGLVRRPCASIGCLARSAADDNGFVVMFQSL
jgi:hypothetical protein